MPYANSQFIYPIDPSVFLSVDRQSNLFLLRRL
ncbi:Uncharacterised protein [Vibrio cholerae]|nr:Uncharacterised protein [Vibrio cholerae]